ncbi:dihydrofolate reductase family protein [Rhodobacter sp. 24-YEA-8]|uniref:dihydrofolate reductase family protein n=1 Tax=Rhodobacter sp. 24-YEA-8 TaxID=1884310 RepID=UPI0008982114|nr:dihydrofolate reductase family protein [Rhodobacter sp. 24-YEA-8]SED31552.1 Dihydrofolate reductase [Rhodobacter sp. 24-YEA-8]
MVTGHVFIAASLDGFIATREGDVSWLTPNGAESEDHGYNAFYDSIDGIIMGRGTWAVVSRFDPWPFDKPVIVLSGSLTQDDVPDMLRSGVRIWNMPPRDAMKKLAAEGWKKAYIDGGKLIQSCLAEDLIQDIILTRVPVLLGAGLPLFGDLPGMKPLKHLHSKSFASGLVQSHYQIGS